MNIADAKVVITGGSSGIGRDTARALLADGARVVICGMNEGTLQRASEELGTPSFRADVSREVEVEALFEFALEEVGGLNVLVNNAGIGGFSPLTDTSLQDFRAHLGGERKRRVPGWPTGGSALHRSEHRKHHQHRFHRTDASVWATNP